MRKTSVELAAEAEALRSEIVSLADVDEPTEEQAARAAVALEEFETVDKARADAVAYETRMDAVRTASLESRNVVSGSFSAPNVNVRKDPFESAGDYIRNARSDDPDLLARAVTAISESTSRGTTDGERDEAIRKIETVPGVAAYALATGSPAYRSAFSKFLKAQGQSELLDFTGEERDAVRASLSLTSANGGYSLPFLLDPTLIHTGTATRNPIRSIARVVTGTQNVWHGVTVGNVTTYWVAENTALTDGSPTFGGPAITAAKLTAYVTASYEVFEDSMLQAQLPGLIGESFDYAESTTFITGSGSGAPKGIVTAISGTAASTVTATTRGAFTTASAVDVFAVLNALPSRYEDSSTWVGNKATFNTIKQMSTGSQGSYFWSDFNNSARGQSLLGSPTVQASDMATAQTSGTKLLVLGDFSQYVIYDRIGTSVEFVPNVVDGSGLPLGSRGLIAHKRVGADVTDVNAFRIFNT